MCFLPFFDDGGTVDSDERCLLKHLRAASPSHSNTMHRVSIASSCSSTKREAVKEYSAILKKAMTERRAGWSKKDWYSQSKQQWRSSAVEDAGQNSHDKCSQPQGKWKGISLEMDALETALKEKTHTWNKSCKESARRKTELYKMVEIAAIDERQEARLRTP